MINLNITIGGNLCIELQKGAKEELKELIEKATNTDAILTDLLEAGRYIGNDWHIPQLTLTEAPAIAFGIDYQDEENEIVDYDKLWYYPNYMITSFVSLF